MPIYSKGICIQFLCASCCKWPSSFSVQVNTIFSQLFFFFWDCDCIYIMMNCGDHYKFLSNKHFFSEGSWRFVQKKNTFCFISHIYSIFFFFLYFKRICLFHFCRSLNMSQIPPLCHRICHLDISFLPLRASSRQNFRNLSYFIRLLMIEQ